MVKYIILEQTQDLCLETIEFVLRNATYASCMDLYNKNDLFKEFQTNGYYVINTGIDEQDTFKRNNLYSKFHLKTKMISDDQLDQIKKHINDLRIQNKPIHLSFKDLELDLDLIK